MIPSRQFLIAASVSALLVMAGSTSAATVTLDFQLTTSNGNPVTDLFVYSTAPGLENLYLVPDILAPTGVQSLTYSVPFDPVSTLIVGRNPAVGAEGDHIVMFANDGFATQANGQKWSVFFAPLRHSEFVSWVANAHNGDAVALAALSDFLRGPQAAAAAYATHGPATILEFSTGAPVGGVIPESSSKGVALFSLGLVSLAFTRRLCRGKSA